MSPEGSLHPLWKHFERLNKYEMKCRTCDKTYNKRNMISAKRHLIRHHGYDNEKDYLKWRNDTYCLWRYFSREAKYIARCNLCGKSLKCAIRGTIESHLNHRHKDAIAAIQEEITRTWLSRHFIFKNCYATCKLQDCNYKVKMYRIDQLKFHLNNRHNINDIDDINDEYSGCKERTGDNNEDRMTQQFVHENNYAGPSSHHDNIHWQFLGNREGDRMIRYSVHKENYAGLSSYRNNAHWQFLENRKGDRTTQYSVYEENYAGLSSYHNNTRRQSFGNREGDRMIQYSVPEINYTGPYTSSYHNKIITHVGNFLKIKKANRGKHLRSNVDNNGQQGSTSYDILSDFGNLRDYVLMDYQE